jgi:hypothetical protein
MKCYNGIISVRLRIILCALIYTNTDPAQHGTGLYQAQPNGGRAGTARRASRAVPNRASCLAISPSTTCWVNFWARVAR